MLPKFVVYSLSFIVFAFFASPALAQTATQSSVDQLTPSPLPLPPYVAPTSPLYTDLLIHNMFHTFSCLAIGQSVIGQPCLTYQMTKNAQGILQGVPVLSQINTTGGVLGATTNIIGLLYQNPPVRTADYLASVGQGLGIIKTANAQVVGSGANVLSPIIKLWQVSRNISYILLIIIFLVIGLMIMFRNKINPQTVITAQAALPGLVIGLIMITFSFFFAGLISDMAFVGTNIVGYYFSAAKDQANKPQNLAQEISTDSVLSIFGQLTGILDSGKAGSIMKTVMSEMSEGVQNTIRIFAFFFAAQFVGPLAGSVGGLAPPWGLIAGPAISIIAGLTVASFPTQVLGLVLSIIASLVLLYSMLKLLLRLVNCYLTIIFLTISAPFQLLFSALPGRQGIATGWIMNMLANVLIFPAVVAVLYFAVFILNDKDYGPLKIASNYNQIQNNSIIPVTYAAGGKMNIIGTATFPLFGGMDLGFLRIVLAFGLLVALPSIPDIVIRSVSKASEAGQLIGQEISGGVRSGRQYTGQATNAAFGTTQGLSQGVMGERGLVYNPGTQQFDYKVTKPGIKQIERNGSLNPFKWKVKSP